MYIINFFMLNMSYFYYIQVKSIEFLFYYVGYNNKVFLNFLLKDFAEDM